jgi:hypothetical protein
MERQVIPWYYCFECKKTYQALGVERNIEKHRIISLAVGPQMYFDFMKEEKRQRNGFVK